MKPLFALALLLAVLGSARGEAAAPGDELVARERAFAKHAAEAGIRPAFLEAMADNAVLFMPGGPVDGPAWHKAHANPAVHLHWCPEQWLLAASGDLGITMGPWRLTPEADAQVLASGTFFSVWQRLADGQLKLLTDSGVNGELRECPENTAGIPASGMPLPADATAADRALRWQSLGAADDTRNAIKNPSDAPIALHESDTKSRGLPAAQTGRRLSIAADLGVTWGVIGEPTQEGYVRIWLFRSEGWELLIERAP